MTNAKTKKSEYDIQAKNFLKKTGATIEAIYTGHRPYFDNEKEFRATFYITIKKGDKSMSFNFGNSLVDSWELKVYHEPTKQYKSCNINDFDFTKSGSRRLGERKDVKEAINTGKNGFIGSAIEMVRKQKTPSDYSILACLTTYDPGTFEEFCNNYGYDTDSRRAEKLYHSNVKEYKDLIKLFNTEELSELAEIC